MEKSKTFQIAVIGTFVVLIIFGFLAFSGYLPLPGGKGEVNYGTVTLWGTLPATAVQQLVGETLGKDPHIKIEYVEKKNESFDLDFIEALARGKGPDLILVSQDNVLKTLDKLTLIPYTVMPERDFKNAFLPEGELFLRPQGIAALPFSLDPVVMYWNRDLFTNALIVAPPTLWTQFYDIVPKITIRDTNGNITRSLVSFGEYRNVSHAKEIISLLLLQAGTPIVSNQSGSLTPAFVGVSDGTGSDNTVTSAIRFFTEFSKPGKDAYSWNRSLPLSRTMFEAGDLALYFGYASEYKSIQGKNPHLNFDIAPVPQTGSVTPSGQAPTRLTFGEMQGVAVVKSGTNIPGATYAAMLLSSKDSIASLSTLTGLPPVRRDLINVRSGDAIQTVFYDAAILSRAWYDPSPNDTDRLFLGMIDGITSGRTMISEALDIAQSGMARFLGPYKQ